jgi:hypothetical protein
MATIRLVSNACFSRVSSPAKGVDGYGMVQVHGEILPAEKLAYSLVAAAFVDDEDHRIKPQRLRNHVVYKHGLPGSRST